MDLNNWSGHLEQILKYAGILGGFWGFYKSFIEYRNAQKWKKVEFIAKEAKEFFADKNVSRALIFLDYKENDIPVYENEIDGKKTLRYNNNLLMLSLDPERNITELSQEEALIRRVFDDFLTKLGFFNNYIDTNLIQQRDLVPYLEYWMNVLANPHKSKRNRYLMTRIWLYIDKYSHDDVRKLARKFNLTPNFTIPIEEKK